MTAARIPPAPAPSPPPSGSPACPPPSPAALHRRTARSLRSVPRQVPRDPLPPRSALVFADAALRRVLEVADRRRPIAPLRPLVAPALIDTVIGLTRAPQTAVATLRRVRVRMVDGDEENQAEVFGSYT